MVVAQWPTSLWLVRHAESEGNLADRRAREAGSHVVEVAERDPDVALSPTGREQARALAAWLADRPADRLPQVVLSSPYQRARATAGALGDALGVPVHLDERLRERELGVLDGLTGHGVRARMPEEADRRDRLGKFYYRPPGGESWCDVALRVRAVLADVRAERAGARVVLVTHQAVITVARYVLDGLTEAEVLELDRGTAVPNASLTRYEGDGSGVALQAWGDVAPLAGEPVTDEPDDSDESDRDDPREPAHA